MYLLKENEIYLYTNDKHVYYINRTTGTWIKEQKIRDPDDPNSNEYGTKSIYGNDVSRSWFS